MPSIFSKIIAKEIPAKIVYEDERTLAFRDIDPKAPTHILVIPRQEIPELGAATPADEALLGHLLLVAHHVAQQEGIAASGYRLVINNGPHAGQAVPHIHIHVLGGRKLGWPPG
jgi:histidine triad (HIT) family protein